MEGLDVKQRHFVDPPSRRYLAEYLIEYRFDDPPGYLAEYPSGTVFYKLDCVAYGYENIVTRPATHSDKVRLYGYRHRETITTIRSSRMRDLHARLALAIYRQDDCCPHGFNQREWNENLLRAKGRIEKRKLGTNDLGVITGAIIPRRWGVDWRERLCRWCRTPFLIGYFLDGEQITRGKEYCSPACKMRLRR